MSMVLAFVLIATSIATEPENCPSDVRLFLAQRARQVYVDPSEPTQKRVTEEMRRQAFPIFGRDPDCAKQMLPEIAWYGHPAALDGDLGRFEKQVQGAIDRAIAEEGYSGRRVGTLRPALSGISRGRGVLRRRTGRGSVSTLALVGGQTLESTCRSSLRFTWRDACDDWLDGQVREGRFSVRGVLAQSLMGGRHSNPSQLEAQIAWLKLLEQVPERSERLWLALYQPREREQQHHLRALALDTMIGDVDPRNWATQDLALAISFGKALDEMALAERAKPPTQRGGFGIAGGRADDPALRDVLFRLRPLGFRNAFELIGVKSIVVPGINAPSADTILDGDSWVPAWEHFRDERELYADDWFSTASSSGETSVQYKERRWRETDGAAPPIDLAAVREALERIESHGRLVWTGGRASTDDS